MANIDKLKAQIDNLRENYKALMTLLLMCLGGVGTMIYMAIDKKNGVFYILAASLIIVSTLIVVALRKTWVDLDKKSEELGNV